MTNETLPAAEDPVQTVDVLPVAAREPVYDVDYRDLLLKLFPKGRAWQIEDGSVTNKFIKAVATQLKRVDTAVQNIYREADPRTAVDTLAEWEAQFGIPDECSVLAGTIAERRSNLIAKITATGGQSASHFKTLLGTPIDFAINYVEPTTLPMTLSGPVRGLGFKHIWYAVLSEAASDWFEAGDPVGEPISSPAGDTTRLQCLIEKYKPAHTYVVYQ